MCKPHGTKDLCYTSWQVCYKGPYYWQVSFILAQCYRQSPFIPFLHLLIFFTSKHPFQYFFSLKDFATPCKTRLKKD